MSEDRRRTDGPSPTSRSRGGARSRTKAVGDLYRLGSFAAGASVPAYVALRQGGLDLVIWHEAAIALWWALALCFLFRALPRGRPSRLAIPALVCGSALVGWTALSLAWTESAERTFDELARVLGYLGVVGLVWVAVNRETWRLVAAGLLTGAMAVVLIAIFARLTPDAFAGLTTPISIDGRLTYPLGYWNALGAWAAMTVVLALAWSASASAPIARGLALGLAPVAGLAVYLSFSRGAVIATVIGVAAVIALSRDRITPAIHAAAGFVASFAVALVLRAHPELLDGTGDAGAPLVVLALVVAGLACGSLAALARPGRHRASRHAGVRRALLAAAGAVAVAAVLVGPRVVAGPEPEQAALQYPAQQRADPAARLTSLSGERGELWSQGLDAFGSRPISGIGPGTYEFWWMRHEGPRSVRDAHSLYVETLAELGIVGLVLLLAFLAAILGAAINALRGMRRSSSAGIAAGLIAALLVLILQGGVDWLWDVPAIPVLGLAAGMTAIASSGESSRRHRPSRRLGIGIAVLMLIAGAVQIPGVVSKRLVRDSAVLLARGETDRAADFADDAVTAEPWSATARAQRALVAEREGRLDDALVDALDAVSREPTNWRHRVLVADIERLRGERSVALARLRDAAQLMSVDPTVVQSLSVLRTSSP